MKNKNKNKSFLQIKIIKKMKSYPILVLLCLIAFILCNNQFTSGRKRPNLRALRPTTRFTTKRPVKTTKHTTKSKSK